LDSLERYEFVREQVGQRSGKYQKKVDKGSIEAFISFYKIEIEVLTLLRLYLEECWDHLSEEERRQLEITKSQLEKALQEHDSFLEGVFFH